jgi:hypothetical protein
LCDGVFLVVMEWMAVITGDHVGLLLDILPKRKFLDFPWQKQMLIKIRCLQLKSGGLRVVEFRQHPHLGARFKKLLKIFLRSFLK